MRLVGGSPVNGAADFAAQGTSAAAPVGGVQLGTLRPVSAPRAWRVTLCLPSGAGASVWIGNSSGAVGQGLELMPGQTQTIDAAPNVLADLYAFGGGDTFSSFWYQ